MITKSQMTEIQVFEKNRVKPRSKSPGSFNGVEPNKPEICPATPFWTSLYFYWCRRCNNSLSCQFLELLLTNRTLFHAICVIEKILCHSFMCRRLAARTARDDTVKRRERHGVQENFPPHNQRAVRKNTRQ